MTTGHEHGLPRQPHNHGHDQRCDSGKPSRFSVVLAALAAIADAAFSCEGMARIVGDMPGKVLLAILSAVCAVDIELQVYNDTQARAIEIMKTWWGLRANNIFNWRYQSIGLIQLVDQIAPPNPGNSENSDDSDSSGAEAPNKSLKEIQDWKEEQLNALEQLDWLKVGRYYKEITRKNRDEQQTQASNNNENSNEYKQAFRLVYRGQIRWKIKNELVDFYGGDSLFCGGDSLSKDFNQFKIYYNATQETINTWDTNQSETVSRRTYWGYFAAFHLVNTIGFVANVLSSYSTFLSIPIVFGLKTTVLTAFLATPGGQVVIAALVLVAILSSMADALNNYQSFYNRMLHMGEVNLRQLLSAKMVLKLLLIAGVFGFISYGTVMTWQSGMIDAAQSGLSFLAGQAWLWFSWVGSFCYALPALIFNIDAAEKSFAKLKKLFSRTAIKGLIESYDKYIDNWVWIKALWKPLADQSLPGKILVGLSSCLLMLPICIAVKCLECLVFIAHCIAVGVQSNGSLTPGASSAAAGFAEAVVDLNFVDLFGSEKEPHRQEDNANNNNSTIANDDVPQQFWGRCVQLWEQIIGLQHRCVVFDCCGYQPRAADQGGGDHNHHGGGCDHEHGRSIVMQVISVVLMMPIAIHVLIEQLACALNYAFKLLTSTSPGKAFVP